MIHGVVTDLDDYVWGGTPLAMTGSVLAGELENAFLGEFWLGVVFVDGVAP